jgi:hypothetical protein
LRAELGPAFVNCLFVLAGFGVLNAIGFVRPSIGDVLAATGLAYLAGLGVSVMVSIVLLTAGVAVRLPLFAALAVAIGVLGLATRREWFAIFRTKPVPPPSSWRRRDFRRTIAAVSLFGFGLYAAAGFAVSAVRPLVEWDSWSIWTRKASELFYTGSLPTEFFASPAYAFMHPDYPIFIPVVEMIQFRARGGIDTQQIHVQFWLLLVTFVWALAYLAARRGTLSVWLPLAIVVGVTPAVYGQLLTAYADIPMALFLVLGLLLLGQWLARGDWTDLALGTLFLVVSANTKNEGLVASTVALVAAGLILALTGEVRRLRPLGFAAIGFAGGVLPWLIWRAANGVHGEIPFKEGLDPSYLLHRLDRVWPSITALYTQVSDQTQWLYAIPLAAALALLALTIPRLRSLASFYLVTGFLFFLSLVWVYWASAEPLAFFLNTSAYRVVAGLAAVSLAAILELAASTQELFARSGDG